MEGISFPLDESVTVAGQERKRLTVQVYSFDPTLGPEGKTAPRVMLSSDYDHCKKLREDPERYRAEQERIVDTV